VEGDFPTAEGLDDGLLGGEACGEGSGAADAVGPLLRGEDAAAKALAVAGGEGGDAIDLDDVDAGFQHGTGSVSVGPAGSGCD
jgi:hypothetical protein